MKALSPRTQRSSNLELFRIVTMFLIVAHHYVTSSGLTSADGPIFSSPLSWQSIFLLLLGAWGKIGINCFVLITGYFMCKSRITPKKFAKLVCEVFFYKTVSYLIFLLSGKISFSLMGFVEALLPIAEVGVSFTGAFLCFYLCIPFLNILLQNMKEKQHLRLLALSFFIYVFFGTIKVLPVTMNYVSWFIVLYFIASYIRLYPKNSFNSTRLWGWMTVISIAVSATSVLACTWLGAKLGRNSPYAFVADSNTFLAVLTGFSAFMFFKNLKVKQSAFINTVSSATFGVFLVHTSGSALRHWLWNDVCQTSAAFSSPLLPVYAIASVLGIFVAGTCIDLLRQRFIEKPFFALWDKKWEHISKKWQCLEGKLCKKFNVTED